MFAQFLLLLCAAGAACWSTRASLDSQETEHSKPTTTALDRANVQPRSMHVANQVILVHPSDDLVSTLSNASAGDVLLLTSGVYMPAADDVNCLVIDKDITIVAQQPGQAVLDGQGKRRVLYVKNGNVLLKGINITNGQADQDGGGIYNNGGAVTIESCQIYANHTGDAGGGIFSDYDAVTLTINSSNIYRNEAATGGGINRRGLDGGGAFTITSSNIYENSIGGMVVDGPASIISCNIYSNTADQGGGIRIGEGDDTTYIISSNIYENKANLTPGFFKNHRWGGGIFMAGCTAVIQSSLIYSNSAGDDGGGVFLGATPDYTVAHFKNCSISGNQAQSGGGIYASPYAGGDISLDLQSFVGSNQPDNCWGFDDPRGACKQ